jgi:hypothetical protein
MKKLASWTRPVSAALMSLMWAGLAFAQTAAPNATTRTTTTTTTTWVSNVWIWAAIGVGVFLIVVIAITSRGGRTNTR